MNDENTHTDTTPQSSNPYNIIVKPLRTYSYEQGYAEMTNYLINRNSATQDEIWMFEAEEAFYTTGKGVTKDLSTAYNDLKVIPSKRGGKMTAHAPGQITVVVLLDLRKRGLSLDDHHKILLKSMLETVQNLGCDSAWIDKDNPGVYAVTEQDPKVKIGSIGVRTLNFRYTYYGITLNVDMDLDVWGGIDPCGDPELKISDLRTLGISSSITEVSELLSANLVKNLTPS